MFSDKSVSTINTINIFIIIGKKFNYLHSTLPRTEKGGNYASLAATWAGGGGVYLPLEAPKGKKPIHFLKCSLQNAAG
jgi:hypothetical protein